MKLFKLFDWSIQTICLAIGIANAIINWNGNDCIFSYMLVGGANLISWFIHLFLSDYRHKWTIRSVYHILLAVVVLISILPLPLKGTIVIIMYILAPLMALLYWWISLRETIDLPTSTSLSKTPGHEQ